MSAKILSLATTKALNYDIIMNRFLNSNTRRPSWLRGTFKFKISTAMSLRTINLDLNNLEVTKLIIDLCLGFSDKFYLEDAKLTFANEIKHSIDTSPLVRLEHRSKKCFNRELSYLQFPRGSLQCS